ncbi:hypothetical protein GH714_032196 [Hevea brasiliensis]|uniref:Uncharacterized protein n=1 Tax=Hevea brasiliensis TaxID=3981 RepID=A0A6A6L1K2_HEVBR|nr:hypothetical protein GH714_032196 [Hevea brasiliensis]
MMASSSSDSSFADEFYAHLNLEEQQGRVEFMEYDNVVEKRRWLLSKSKVLNGGRNCDSGGTNPSSQQPAGLGGLDSNSKFKSPNFVYGDDLRDKGKNMLHKETNVNVVDLEDTVGLLVGDPKRCGVEEVGNDVMSRGDGSSSLLEELANPKNSEEEGFGY